MIKTLHISNYALIDALDIEFDSGFNIITGETGAGKSIILGALSLLLGERADIKAVRRGERKSVIEGVFSLGDAPDVERIIIENELDRPVDGECILRRELLPGGRSRAFVNDTPVTLPVLRDLASHLVDIHSQHANLQLTSEDYQLNVLDILAVNGELLNEYHKVFASFREALQKYTKARDMLRRNRDDADFLAYQYEQLAAMNLHPGEHEALEQEREVLANVSEINENLAAALDPLSIESPNALGLISNAVDALTRLADTLGEGEQSIDFRVLAERLESARIEISDINDTLVEAGDTIAADPDRLQEIEDRLSKIYSLELKHHVDTTDALIELRDNIKAQIDTLDNGDNILRELEMAAKRAKKSAINIAQQLSERRSATANELSAELVRRAAPLGMPNLRCSIVIEKGKLGHDGFDTVRFLFAFNKNQEPMPLGSTASGGEISRLMLTLKSIVAERTKLPSIIFDEVDTGVSGDIAGRMGATMALVSRYLQVVAITHLPGIAALGDKHFKVYKEDDDRATNTHIKILDDAARRKELALMISGNPDDQAALASADALLNSAINN